MRVRTWRLTCGNPLSASGALIAARRLQTHDLLARVRARQYRRSGDDDFRIQQADIRFGDSAIDADIDMRPLRPLIEESDAFERRHLQDLSGRPRVGDREKQHAADVRQMRSQRLEWARELDRNAGL